MSSHLYGLYLLSHNEVGENYVMRSFINFYSIKYNCNDKHKEAEVGCKFIMYGEMQTAIF
jgi:hypothetical protein